MSKPNQQPPPPTYTQTQQPGVTTFPAQPPPQGGYYPQPQVYPAGPGYVGVHVINPVLFREFPVSTVCPHCSAGIVTQVTRSTGILPWLLCGGIFLIAPLGCCLIPFCIDDLKDSIHTCPQCRRVVGQYKRV